MRNLLRLISRFLPAPQRERYLEEWLADLAGARELGIAPIRVVTGALRSSWHIGRHGHVELSLPATAQGYLHARWALALLGSGGILLLGQVFAGGYQPQAGTPAAVQAVLVAMPTLLLAGAVLLLATGYWKVIRAVCAPLSGRTRGAAITVALLVLLVVLGLIVTSVAVPGVLLYLAALITALLHVANGSGVLAVRREMSCRTRAAVAIPAVLLMILLAWAGCAWILYWNPQAKVPWLELEQIYAQMDHVNEAPGLALVLAWAISFSLLGGWFGYATWRGRHGILWEARTLAASWLGLFALLAGGYFVASFPMGMSLADTFGIGGGDAGSVGLLVMLLGNLALAAAVFAAASPGAIAPAAGETSVARA